MMKTRTCAALLLGLAGAFITCLVSQASGFGGSFGGSYLYDAVLRPLPTETNVVLLCSTVWPDTSSDAVAAPHRIERRVAAFIEALTVTNRFAVACFSETAALWTNRLQHANQKEIGAASQFLRNELPDADVAPPATAISRLDRALATVLPYKPHMIVLLTSGNEFGATHDDPNAPPKRWTTADCTNFLVRTWDTLHSTHVPADFRLNVIAFDPDRRGHAFCRDLARAFGGLYRVRRTLTPSSMQLKSSNKPPGHVSSKAAADGGL